MTTAATYVRVSTRDKGQTNDNQLLELRAFAERLGYTIYQGYCDQESGGTAERPRFQQLFESIKKCGAIQIRGNRLIASFPPESVQQLDCSILFDALQYRGR